MNRLIILIIGFFLICTPICANQELEVHLDKVDQKVDTKELGGVYGIATFTLEDCGDNHYKVLVELENTTVSEAILLFKNTQDETILKSHKPKITFEKTYPAKNVFGNRELNQSFISILPSEKKEIMVFDIKSTSEKKLELTLYFAKYDSKQATKKGRDNVNYKILREDKVQFNITLKGWTENDPEYVATKKSVDDFIASLKGVSFCNHKKHKPSLAQQQKPYIEKRDSLIQVIANIVESNGWMSDIAPSKAYQGLREQLEGINFKQYIHDCGNHYPPPTPPTPPTPKSCSYCGMSAQQISHQLEDIYIQLRNGKISKDAAVKKARGLYNCYQKHDKRKKDGSFGGKISKYYNAITNF